MTSKRMVIADITSLKSGNKSFGHFFYVAEMYHNIFSGKFDVSIAGGPIYETKFTNLKKLQYHVDLQEFNQRSTKLKSKLKELLNARKVLKDTSNEHVVFQDYSNTILFLSILLFRSKNKIFLIQYKNEIKSRLRRLLFRLIKNRIAGVIVSKSSIGAEYGIPYIVVPDYIYVGKEGEDSKQENEYDYGVFGIIRKGKDVVGVAQSFAERPHLRLLIAGSIQDAEMRAKLEKLAAENGNITLIDRYLGEEEYDRLIKSTKCIVLPYTDDYYNESSSGVIFDILFRQRPVITRQYEIFSFVDSQQVGVLYERLNEIDWDSIIEEGNYRKVQGNIHTYLEHNAKQRSELVQFVMSR